MRKVLLFVGLAFAGLPAASAVAATTIGQTGVPLTDVAWAGGFEDIQAFAAMPAAGTVTSFQTQAGTACENVLGIGVYDFQVLHPLGGDQYKVLGDTNDVSDLCDGQLHFYPVNITVQAGDLLGVYVVVDWYGVLSPTTGSRNFDAIAAPAVGDTITVPNAATGTIDEAATFVLAVPMTIDQCTKGGWKTFGSAFKNEGDCVSFVATRGNNPPAG